VPSKDISKDEIRSFWEQNPLFTGETDLEPGSRAFFERHEAVYRDDVFAGEGFPDHFFPFAPGAAVLDVGCGPGIWTRELARRGYTVTAVDLTERAVELTRRSLGLFGLKGEVRQGDAENLPFPDASFDGVVSHGVIHHTPDTARCVREIGRVLKPGQLAVVSVYHRNLILRRPTLTRLANAIAGRFVALPGRGRERLLSSADPDEIVRLYDGSSNPLGKAYIKAEFDGMFEAAGMAVEERHLFYIPARAFGPLKALITPMQAALARRFGLMYAVVARRTS
jgi:2-polyprenyl-3-methyl-5-hydroxy-6-metoxy-1,4-benzoquinol methylase